MATVGEGKQKRLYLAPTEDQENTIAQVYAVQGPTQSLANDPRNLWCVGYGLDTFDKLFSPRQLVALTLLLAIYCKRPQKKSFQMHLFIMNLLRMLL